MLKKIRFFIKGIHCRSCKVLIETEVDVLAGVNKVEVDYKNGWAEVEFDEGKISKAEIFKEIKKLNYEVKDNNDIVGKLSEDKSKNRLQVKSFLYGLIIPLGAVILIGGYSLVKNFGGFELLAELNEGNVGYGLIFIIGLLASFHCVGMCGGLVVAYSANELKKEEKKGKTWQPHFYYNIGRFISYTILGGVLGGLGSFFGINPTFTGIIILVASIFMILMGLSFVSGWQILEKVKLRTPQFVAKYLYNQKHSKKSKGPFVIGLLNVFMPCGPLQAMQLYALAAGSVFQGALSMGIYSLGTIPLMFGFGLALSSISQRYFKKILKASGVLIIILGIFMANRGLTNLGYGFGNLFSTNNINQEKLLIDGKKYQEVKMDLTYLGYKPNVLYIKRGVPVRWIINVKQMSGCTNAIIIESLNIKKDLKHGENIIEFTPPNNVSEIKFSCWMKMVWGKFVITDKNANPTKSDIEKESSTLPTGSSCGGSSGGGCGCGG